MQAVILAGGIGTRLRPLTEEIPKPMVHVQDKPFLQYLLELLKSYNMIDEVLLLVSYLGDQIEEYFKDGKSLGVSIKYSYEKSPLGTGGALKNAESKLKNEFLLLNGDTYLPINYNSLIKSFYKSDKQGLIVAYDNSQWIVPNNLAVNESNIVISYNKKEQTGLTHVDAGAIMLKREVLRYIPEGCICSLEEETFCKLIAKRELSAFPTNQRFYDMGSFQGLETIRSVLR